MFPWLWINATDLRFPLSGEVDQDLSETFFNGIKPGAGVPGIEKQVFDQASYGKQLGWLTDVLVEAISARAMKSAEGRESLAKLKDLHSKIGRIKKDHRQDRFDAATALLDRMQADSPDELRRLLRRYDGGDP